MINRLTSLKKKPYFSAEEAEALRNYKSRGGDLGIFYQYFYSPLANWCVSKTPEWVAPNTLTFIGFICCVVPVAVMYTCFGASNKGELPTWFILMSAACFFLYRLLDEMDGK